MLERYFTIANKNNEEVQAPYYDMLKFPSITLKPSKNTCKEDHFQQKYLKDLTLPKLFLKNLSKYTSERLLTRTLFCDNCLNFTVTFFVTFFS